MEELWKASANNSVSRAMARRAFLGWGCQPPFEKEAEGVMFWVYPNNAGKIGKIYRVIQESPEIEVYPIQPFFGNATKNTTNGVLQFFSRFAIIRC